MDLEVWKLWTWRYGNYELEGIEIMDLETMEIMDLGGMEIMELKVLK